VFKDIGGKSGLENGTVANSLVGVDAGRLMGEKYAYYRDYAGKMEELRLTCPANPNPIFLSDCQIKDPVSYFAEEFTAAFDMVFNNTDPGFMNGFDEITSQTSIVGESDASLVFNHFGNKNKGYINYRYTFTVSSK